MLFGVWLHPGLLRPINPIHNITGASSTTTTAQFRVSPSTTATGALSTTAIRFSGPTTQGQSWDATQWKCDEYFSMAYCQSGWMGIQNNSQNHHKRQPQHLLVLLHFHKINAQCKGYPMDNIHIVRQEAVECSLKGNHWYLWKCIWYLCWSILERKRASWVFWCSPDAIIW